MGSEKNDRDREECFGGYGQDGDNGVVGIGGDCSGDEDGITGGWDGGAVGLRDAGGIKETGGTVGGGVVLAGSENAAMVGVGGVVKTGVGWVVL